MLAILELADIFVAIGSGVAALAVELAALELPDIPVTIGKRAGAEAVTPPCGTTTATRRQVTLRRHSGGNKCNDQG
jgi:hypothetical protein